MFSWCGGSGVISLVTSQVCCWFEHISCSRPIRLLGGIYLLYNVYFWLRSRSVVRWRVGLKWNSISTLCLIKYTPCYKRTLLLFINEFIGKFSTDTLKMETQGMWPRAAQRNLHRFASRLLFSACQRTRYVTSFVTTAASSTHYRSIC